MTDREGADPVHWRHSIDGYPLCWPMDRDGSFEATSHEDRVTCTECVAILADDS